MVHGSGSSGSSNTLTGTLSAESMPQLKITGISLNIPNLTQDGVGVKIGQKGYIPIKVTNNTNATLNLSYTNLSQFQEAMTGVVYVQNINNNNYPYCRSTLQTGQTCYLTIYWEPESVVVTHIVNGDFPFVVTGNAYGSSVSSSTVTIQYKTRLN